MSQPALKHEVNERLAAYRNRRGGQAEPAQPIETQAAQAMSAREAQIKARVAARFANAPSYNDAPSVNSSPVERVIGAVTKAAVEAVIAEMGQAAVTPTLWEAPPAQQTYAPPPAQVQASVTPSRWQQDEPVPQPAMAAAAQTRWEDAVPPQVKADEDVWESMRVSPAPYQPARRAVAPPRPSNEGELFAYDPMDPASVDDPMRTALVEPAQPIQANVIEFPRPLVAPRKGRPRLAEGPYHRAEDVSQLSIFEVDPEQMDEPFEAVPTVAEQVAPPEWASIELEEQFDHHEDVAEPEAPQQVSAAPVAYKAVAYEAVIYAEPEETYYDAPSIAEPVAVTAAASSWDEYTLRESYAPQLAQMANARRGNLPAEASSVELLVAPVSDRAMAAVVDLGVVALATVVASFAALACMSQAPSARIALVALGASFVLIGLVYQYIFLSFAEKGTVGMSYARIALCTFDDDNPSREQMRMRILATVLAALPAGLGLAWSLVDKEHVAWHDRLTRTYQRKY